MPHRYKKLVKVEKISAPIIPPTLSARGSSNSAIPTPSIPPIMAPKVPSNMRIVTWPAVSSGCFMTIRVIRLTKIPITIQTPIPIQLFIVHHLFG